MNSRKGSKIGIQLGKTINETLTDCLFKFKLENHELNSEMRKERLNTVKKHDKIHWVGRDKSGVFDPNLAKDDLLRSRRRQKISYVDNKAKSVFPWWGEHAKKNFHKKNEIYISQNKEALGILKSIKNEHQFASTKWQSQWVMHRQLNLIKELRKTLLHVKEKHPQIAELFQGKILVLSDKMALPCANDDVMCICVNETSEGIKKWFLHTYEGKRREMLDQVNELESKIAKSLGVRIVRPASFETRIASSVDLETYLQNLKVIMPLFQGEDKNITSSTLIIAPHWITPILTTERDPLFDLRGLSLSLAKETGNFILSVNRRNIKVDLTDDRIKQVISQNIENHAALAESYKIEKSSLDFNESALRKKIIETFFLHDLIKDDFVGSADMVECLRKILEVKEELLPIFKDTRLMIGQNYFSWYNGYISLPHNWKYYEN